MHLELLAALGAFHQFLKDNREIPFRDESRSRELDKLDGRIRLFSERLNLRFPSVPLPDTSPGIEPYKPYGFCQVPYFVAYTISDVEIHGKKGAVREKPVRCFLLAYEWESAFNVFVSMVETLRAVSTEAGPAASAPTNPPAGANATEGGPLTGTERDKAFQKLERAVRQAYLSYQFAESKRGCRLEDKEAYDLLVEEGISTDQGNLGELIDYSLPNFQTWSRQLRDARKALREQKYNRRGRRPARSIVNGNKLENQTGDS